MRRILTLTGRDYRRYSRIRKNTGVLAGVAEFAIAMLDMSPPDLSWLVRELVERQAETSGRDALDYGALNDRHPHPTRKEGLHG